ncbi:MAG: CRISPR-associated endonuclease Cas2 [Saprospiraceae bacterium]|nr:CRISPR-associated endonuclease Cas2 [Saprospiraceae bacterium]
MVRKKFTVICYDVSEDKKRNKVAALLERYGTRRNKSVFECMITEVQLKKIRADLPPLIDPTTDTILIYRICLDCYVKSETIGKMTDSIAPQVLIV